MIDGRAAAGAAFVRRGAPGRVRRGSSARAFCEPGTPRRPRFAPAQGREHGDFVARLRDHLPSRQTFLDDLVGTAAAHFDLRVRRAAATTVAGSAAWQPASASAARCPEAPCLPCLACAGSAQPASLAEASRALAGQYLRANRVVDLAPFLAPAAAADGGDAAA